ncbi:hypothetical protein D9M68_923940 [compost metagenome]
MQLAYVLDLAARDAGGLHQDVARLVHFIAAIMIDHMQLLHVRCKALHLGAALVEAQQGDNTFVDLGAVVNAATGQNHRYFFVH